MTSGNTTLTEHILLELLSGNRIKQTRHFQVEQLNSSRNGYWIIGDDALVNFPDFRDGLQTTKKLNNFETGEDIKGE